jgi:hypothetical protein
VTPHGTLSGRQAIAKDYAERVFQRYQCHNYIRKGDRVSATGTWSDTFEEIGTIDADNTYSWALVHEGDTWKIRRDTMTGSARSASGSNPV